MKRRDFLKTILAIPGVSVIVSLVFPIFRYFLPSSKPFDLIGKQKLSFTDAQVVAKVSDLVAEPWTAIPFEFIQMNKEFTSYGEQVSRVPAFVVSIPKDPENPKPGIENLEIKAFSRICPHLGCVYNFVPTTEEIKNKYNYPDAKPQEVFFGCPCHLSVYNLTKLIPVQGSPSWVISPKVVSGPAPRPPRAMETKVEGEDVLVTQMEEGGLT